MSLPKQVLPIFSLVIPSSGKRVNYRPFTVREEKMLAQAQQSDDIHVITNALKEVIKACVKDVGDVDTLALFDIEYIITKIRAKSVGEYLDLSMPCDADENHQRIPVRINLDQIEVTIPEGHSKNIHLFDDVGVIMKYPSLKDLENFEKADGLEAIMACMDQIYTQDEMFEVKDQTKEEILEFLESLTEKQIQKIEEQFFKTMPVFKYEMDYVCSECGHKHHKVIKGLSNFFA